MCAFVKWTSGYVLAGVEKHLDLALPRNANFRAGLGHNFDTPYSVDSDWHAWMFVSFGPMCPGFHARVSTYLMLA